MKNSLKLGAGLIAVYLVVKNGRNFGTAMTSTANGGRTLIKTFQGR